ncbi:glycoside hydrolase family 3 [Candidatus Formimonas warabiya]|uniref:beta-N-acetylhexosaminidase n=2 Tax=Formimonas warabiya TaxID=1761012 RepID=A0A3G1KRX4_FORW1|nr:glycoside hydrolase family 3 [Candidatus Formimonas warabiya]
MRTKYLILIIAFAVSLAFGYGAAREYYNNSGDDPVSSPGPAHGSNTEQNTVDPIREQMKTMNLSEKIGQMVMAGIDGYEKDDHVQQMIGNYHVGGFVLLKQNIRDAKQMLSLINALKETNRVNKIPLFLSIDEEGGQISRVPDELIKIPTSKKIGEMNNSSLSYQIGSIIGEELHSFGLNMDFAPVLDINSNPQNPVIGDRAFGSDAGIVSKLGIQTMKGLHGQNIISVVKHFPGHGDTATDSHLGLPTVNNDMERLNSFELLPFSAAIKNKVDAIMIAHILLSKIDPDNPASLSQIVITDLLREKMGFDGVVITDDMTMGAILNSYEIGEAAVKSINAGSDMILVCHDYAKEEAVIKALQQAAETGLISPDRIDQSVYRILKLKQKYALSDQLVQIWDAQKINDQIKGLFEQFPSLKGRQ